MKNPRKTMIRFNIKGKDFNAFREGKPVELCYSTCVSVLVVTGIDDVEITGDKVRRKVEEVRKKGVKQTPSSYSDGKHIPAPLPAC